MARIYTRTGDQGETGLIGGPRVGKDHARVEAYGEVDELNAVLGVVACYISDAQMLERLRQIQSDLFDIGAELATPANAPPSVKTRTLPDERVKQLEAWIDEASNDLETLKHFILPGGSLGASYLHLARAICRRVERSIVSLGRQEPLRPALLVYLNRLSDLLFVWARWVNHREGVGEVLWIPETERGTPSYER